MTMQRLTILYPEDLLLSLKQSPAEFEAQARLLLAVKLYEMHKVTTGMAARLAGISRIEFIFALNRFSISPIGVEPGELAEDLYTA